MEIIKAKVTRDDMKAQFNVEVDAFGRKAGGSAIALHQENLKERCNKNLESKKKTAKILETLKSDPHTTRVKKEDLRSFLAEYTYFNTEKFNKLEKYCFMKDILLSFDIPKYFEVKDIEPQNAQYSDADVGDSDEGFENTSFKLFTLNKALTASDTSVWCENGPIKGDMLMYESQLSIFKQWGTDTVNMFNSSSEDETSSPKKKASARDETILGSLGKYIYEKTTASEKDESNIIKVISYPGHDIVFKLLYLERKTTRLLNPQFSLCDFRVPESSQRLTYKEIATINQRLLEYFSEKLGLGNFSRTLAELQLARLKDTEHRPKKSADACFDKVLKSHKIENEKVRGLMVWVDFLNALIFKVEASRINNSVISGLLMLKLIEHGDLTYKQAFFSDENFLGQFPGASVAKKHNFVTRTQLLAYHGSLGMKTDRQHPTWLMCSLKEAMMMIYALKVLVLDGNDPCNFKREKLLEKFTKYVHETMSTYLVIREQM